VPTTDRTSLQKGAYASPEKLRARRRLWSFAERTPYSSRVSLVGPLSGSETVVDVGCGDGGYLLDLRANGHRGILIGVDFSLGMLLGLPPKVALRIVGDAQALPLDGGVADLVLAMHMLYHVRDIPGSLREVARVLRRRGTFLASTNSELSLRELRDPWSAAMVRAGGPPLRRPHIAFSLENAQEILGSVFSSVEVRPYELCARVPLARVARDYVASLDDIYRPSLPSPELWEEVLNSVEVHAQREIERYGVFTVTQGTGIFICKP
jgi:SAM-dependent methyltransferase